MKDLRYTQAGPHLCPVITLDDQGVGSLGGIHRFTQSAEWEGACVGQILRPDDQEIDVSTQREVLKAVIEHVHRGAESGLS